MIADPTTGTGPAVVTRAFSLDTRAMTPRRGGRVALEAPPILRALALAAVVLLLSLRVLDSVLEDMHVPNAAAYGIGDLASVSTFPPDPGRATRALETWDAYDKTLVDATLATSEAIVAWFIAIDFCFLLVYALLFLSLIRSAKERLALAVANQSRVDEVAAARVATQRIETTVVPKRTERANEAETTMELAVLRVQAAGPAPYRALALLVGSDIAENVLQAAVVYWSAAFFVALWVASLLKWLALVVLAGWLISAAISLSRHRPGGEPGSPVTEWPLRAYLAALTLFRVPLILLGLLAFALIQNEQFADVLRRWVDGGAAPAAGVTAALVTAIVGRALAHRVAYLADCPWNRSAGPVALATTGALLAIGAFLLNWAGRGGLGLLVPAALLLAVAVAHPFLDPQLEPPRVQKGEGRSPARTIADEFLAPLLAALPPTLLGLALIAASLPEVAFSKGYEYAGLVILGLILVGAGGFLAGRSLGLGPPDDQRLPARNDLVAVLGGGVVVAVVGAVFFGIHATAENLGTIGVVLVFALVAFYCALALTWTSERIEPPRLFLALRIRRIPIVALIALWAVGAAPLNDGEYHDVRVKQQPAGSDIAPLTLEDAFDRWLDANGLPPRPDRASEQQAARNAPRRAVPFVLVSAEGGGVRAAYWTALVLDCVFDGRASDTCSEVAPPESVFAASGISGGSLGLAAWAGHLLAPERDAGGWVEGRLDQDFLAPAVAWTLFADVPNALLTLHDLPPFDRDRAAVLEQAWERPWTDDRLERGFLAVWQSPQSETSTSAMPRVPVLILNGTSVVDGCRVNVSILDISVQSTDMGGAEPATQTEPPSVENCLSVDQFAAGRREETWALAASKDVVDFLRCEPGATVSRDVRLSTAALLSARFPYVTPSGRLEPCLEGAARTTWVVDGGYFDTSGASTLVELWERLEPLIRNYNRVRARPCIEPFLLHIDNHYADPPGPEENPRPTEVQVPLRALGGVRGAHEANARQSSADAISRYPPPAGVSNRYVHIYPQAHPGTRAPLGWTLSSSSMADLQKQLRDNNRVEVLRIRSWFDLEPASCSVA